MLKSATTWLTLVQIPLAWEWFKGGWDKIAEGGFGAKFAEELPGTLVRFATQKTATGETITNPNSWYVDSLLSWAKGNPNLFGYMVEYGEIGIGIILFVAVGYCLFTKKKLPLLLTWLVIVGLVGGVFMNLNFYFASAWPASAVSGRGLNLLMALTQAILVGYYISTLGKEASSS